jgi:hypothetical protein
MHERPEAAQTHVAGEAPIFVETLASRRMNTRRLLAHPAAIQCATDVGPPT